MYVRNYVNNYDTLRMTGPLCKIAVSDKFYSCRYRTCSTGTVIDIHLKLKCHNMSLIIFGVS